MSATKKRREFSRNRTPEWFWQRVDKTSGHGPGGECWVWMGKKFKQGYGYLRYGGRSCKAHRLAWELTNGPIPAGMSILHACDNRPCVNPSHMSIGTQTENNADCFAKGRFARGERASKAKLAEAQVLEVLAALQRGESQNSVAKRYEVSSTSIWKIATGQSWKHLRRSA